MNQQIPPKHITRSTSQNAESPEIKYSNGGCFGFEPNLLLIYSANNFSNRIRYPYSILHIVGQFCTSCKGNFVGHDAGATQSAALSLFYIAMQTVFRFIEAWSNIECLFQFV
jgi:hypothetical protein